MGIKVRPLTVEDRKKLSAMLLKMVKSFGAERLLSIISPASEENGKEEPKEVRDGKLIDIGMNLLRSLVETLEDDAHAWFADLIGCKSIEEFRTLPIDTEAEIILQISKRPEVARFFTTASQLSRATKKYAAQLRNGDGK